MGMLLFEDSVDFRFVKYFCQYALGKEPSAFTIFDSGSEWLKLQGEMLLQMYVHSFPLWLSIHPSVTCSEHCSCSKLYQESKLTCLGCCYSDCLT